MACKKCGDPKISKEYKCNRCHLKAGTFKWCVITRVPPEVNDGNHYDEILDLATTDVEITGPQGTKNLLGTAVLLSYKRPVFRQGEIFPMEPDFERELGWGRKASKWDVEYEVFNSRDYKKAILRAYEVTMDVTRNKTNLDMLEQKSIEKEQLTEKQQTLRKAQDPFKVIYGWIKQNHITLKESRLLLGEVFKNDKV